MLTLEELKIEEDKVNESLIISYFSPNYDNKIQIVERKGWGHPDKLADDLAEELSQNYSRHTLKECGAILHHNFDKLCLLGGSSRVVYGGGEIEKPIRVLVNGRASLKLGAKDLCVPELIKSTCKDFFAKRLPLLNVDKDINVELNLSSASSPGRVITDSSISNDREKWFNPESLDDLPERKFLHANDTSIGTGYAPLTEVEQLVKFLSNYLSYRPNRNMPNWLGTDVKIMAFSEGNKVDIIACVPQISRYVLNIKQYTDNINYLKTTCNELVKQNFSNLEVNIKFNARDKLHENEIYLTVVGSSIESGDEGVVGRGNRVNGLITPMRPMNLEGISGKNPSYHVGKVYNVMASEIANLLNKKYGGNVYVNLISKTGSSLIRPWKIIIHMENKVSSDEEIKNFILELLNSIPLKTIDIVNGKMELS